MKMKSGKINIIIIIFLTIIFPLIFILFTYFSFSFLTKTHEVSERKFHIVVTGATENTDFLNNVFNGASSISDRYNAVVELHVPSSKAEESSLKSLFEYASFVNADGIIGFIDNENVNETISPPLNSEGMEIPVVTIGHFNQGIPQISFIGNNYSESGRLLARTAIELWEPDFNVFILNSSGKNTNYSNLINTLSVSLKNASLVPEIFEGTVSENQDSLSSKILEEDASPALIICLTEEDSIRTSQLTTDPLFNNKNKIIGFGDNETISTYFDKGIINALVFVDQENTGAKAIKEIFEYRKNHFANNYVYSGLKIKKGEAKK